MAQELALVKLRLANTADDNYAAVQVVLTLPPGVKAFTEDEGPRDVLAAPGPPPAWGRGGFGHGRPLRTISTFRERATVTSGEPWSVTFPAVHLRPRASVALPIVNLAIPDGFADAELEIGWSATSTSAGGRAEGVLLAQIASGRVPVSALA